MVVNGQTHSIDEITRTISERTAFSGSLITDRNRTTYMNDVVMILKVPAENIVAVSPVDMRSILLQKVIAQSRENGQKLISQIAQLFPLATPDQLDLATSPKTYSELIIQGTSPQSGEKVAVIGWGLKTRNGQFTAPSHIIKEVMNIARANRQAILSFESDPVDLDELRRRQKMIPSIRDLVIPPTTPE